MPTTFAERCGVHDSAREQAVRTLLRRVADEGIDFVRIVWCDLQGVQRGKTILAPALERALRQGIGMVSTIALKDTSDRTAYRVFEPGGTAGLPEGIAAANNLVLLPDPTSLIALPWAPGSAWLRARAWFDDARPMPLDAREVLRLALERLRAAGYTMHCGLELEFHIYRLRGSTGEAGVDTRSVDTNGLDTRGARTRGADANGMNASTDPMQAAWPGPEPAVELIHPGYQLLGDAWFDRCEEPLRIVQRTAQGLGLPLSSLEIELGPSQVEAVFDVTDAMEAADAMLRFRSGVTQALRRAGYHATFMCLPPFPAAMASGWHLHQSLRRVDGAAGGAAVGAAGEHDNHTKSLDGTDGSAQANAFVRAQPAAGTDAHDATHTLSDVGAQWLAGLLEHAAGATALAVPTANAYTRFRPHALAPQSIVWGRDNRGAMLRVIGAAGDVGTRIENRVGEPGANPYLYLASQVIAGMDGLARRLVPPRACDTPYASATSGTGATPRDSAMPDAFTTQDAHRSVQHHVHQPVDLHVLLPVDLPVDLPVHQHDLLPTSLEAALDALHADAVMRAGLTHPVADVLDRVKRQEAQRRHQAQDVGDFDRREYFARF